MYVVFIHRLGHDGIIRYLTAFHPNITHLNQIVLNVVDAVFRLHGVVVITHDSGMCAKPVTILLCLNEYSH